MPSNHPSENLTLTATDQQKPYAEFLTRPPAVVPDDIAAQVENSTHSSGDAIPLDQVNDLLEPGYLRMETGHCRLPDGSFFVAVHTRIPHCTGEMVNWWFDWHAKDPLRYRIWYPECHFDTQFTPAANPHPGDLPFWNTTHYPTEDVGLGRDKLAINFVSPSEFGFDTSRFAEAKVETAICARVGSVTHKLQHHTSMCHFVRATAEGPEIRSRFWMGHRIRRCPFPGSRLLDWSLNTRFVKRRLLPAETGRLMARHCAQEYANLGVILPELYAAFGPSEKAS